VKDVDFAVNNAAGNERIFETFDEAAGFAVGLAASGRENVYIDILCWSRAGAKSVGLAEDYDEDPDASVTQRIEVSVNVVGRVS